MTKKIWILAGEASGDMYGAQIARELGELARREQVELELSGMGGPRMIAAGVPVKVDSTELGVMGVVEVMRLLFTFIGIFFRLVKQARQERPDAVVLIDYPGFNLLFALAMFRAKIPVVWYVAPHLWVWGKWRLPVLSRICTRMLVIFPFEVEVFAPTPLAAEFVGHPLIDIIKARTDPAIVRDPETLLLLPGSRTMELTRLLDPMLQTITQLAARHPELHYHLAAPRQKMATLAQEIYAKFQKKHPDVPPVEISSGDTGYWMQKAGTGLAASGTVTVECAISGLPLVVGYKLNFITLMIAAVLVKLYRGFFTMVNIIANREVYRELLQWHFKVAEILPALEAILPGGSRRQEVEAGMQEVATALQPASSSALLQAAERIWDAAQTGAKPRNK